jgi:hypothetical protein
MEMKNAACKTAITLALVLLALFGQITICSIPVRADQISVFINADNATRVDFLGQTQKFSAGSVIGASQIHQGVDSIGGQYQAAARALGSLGGFDLLASSTLSNGIGDYVVADAKGTLTVEFLVPTNVYSITLGLGANGHGISANGNVLVSGDAFVALDGLTACSLNLNGGTQSCSGPIRVTPGSLGDFYLEADLQSLSFTGGSGTINYWGTFAPSMNYYDANGNLVGHYPFPSPPIPEPGSLLLLGSGILALAGRLRRR